MDEAHRGRDGVNPWLARWRRASAWDVVKSASTWAAEVGFIIPMGSLMLTLQTFLPADGVEPFNRFGAWAILSLARLRVRAVVHPDVDPGRPYVFCQNHVNHFDFCVIYRATPHFKQGLELEDHFSYPFYGWFMKQRGTIPVRSGMAGQLPEIREAFQRTLDLGHSIIAFPEGGRTRDGHVAPFRKGVFVIARDLGVPIVPVSVTGMQDVMRAESWLVRPGRDVTVHMDAPVPTEGVTDDGIPDLMDRVREPMVRHVDRYIEESRRPSRR